MLPFVAALIAPVVGASLYVWLHDRPKNVKQIDTFIYVALPVLIAWQVLPHVWIDRTPWPVFAVAAGAGLIYAIERLSHMLAEHTDNAVILVGVAGMVLHALLEGGSLMPAHATAPFTSAVILHRVLVGLFIWWLLQPRHGTGVAVAGIVSIIAATLIGYTTAAEVFPDGHPAGIDIYQAFVSGSLLHVVFHQGRHDHRH